LRADRRDRAAACRDDDDVQQDARCKSAQDIAAAIVAGQGKGVDQRDAKPLFHKVQRIAEQVGLAADAQIGALAVKCLARAPGHHVVGAHDDKGHIVQQDWCQLLVPGQRAVGGYRALDLEEKRNPVQPIGANRLFANSDLEQAGHDPVLDLGRVLRLKGDGQIRFVCGKARDLFRHEAEGHGVVGGHLQLPGLLILQVDHRLTHLAQPADDRVDLVEQHHRLGCWQQAAAIAFEQFQAGAPFQLCQQVGDCGL